MYAEACEKQLNLFVTIAFQFWGVATTSSKDYDKACETKLRDILDHMGRFCRRHGASFHYVYVLERKRGIGLHAHILCHVGNGMRIRATTLRDHVRRYLKRTFVI